MTSLEDKKGKYFVGRVADFAKRKDWFFGHFQDNDLLKSELVEVAWQNISGKQPAPEDKHYHKNSIEINIILSGQIRCKINGKRVEVKEREFFVIYPYTVVEEFATGENTELIVIRAPSLPDDKFPGNPEG